MKAIPWRVQVGLVAVSYVAVLVAAGALLFARHLQYVADPNGAAAAGGMYACGDLILELFIGGMFLIPTVLLVLVIRKSEAAYTRYSQVMLALSLTAPISLAVFIPAVGQTNNPLGWFCEHRMIASPMMIVALAVSRWFASFGRAKRLISYALLFEVGTLLVQIGWFLIALWVH